MTSTPLDNDPSEHTVPFPSKRFVAPPTKVVGAGVVVDVATAVVVVVEVVVAVVVVVVSGHSCKQNAGLNDSPQTRSVHDVRKPPSHVHALQPSK